MTSSVVGDRELPERSRRRGVRLTAIGITVGVAAAAIVGSTGGTAAAATAPKSQSVGRFLDGSAGGMPIQSIVDLVDARAKAAPNTSQRNPLEAKVLGQADAPIGNSLQLPGGGALQLGAANQLADANTDGSSLGASGALLNSGAASVGGDNAAYPSDAKVNLSAALIGSVPIPGLSGAALPGLPSIPGLPTGSTTDLAALGGITADLGSTAAAVQTAKGGKVSTARSGIATVKLVIGSPALGALLAQLKALLDPAVLTNVIGSQANTSALGTLLSKVPGAGSVLGNNLPGVLPVPGVLAAPALPAGPGASALPAGPGAPALPAPPGAPGGGSTGSTTNPDCSLTATNPPAITFDDGAVTIDPATATITIDAGKLVSVLLGRDISNLDTSNFDLIDFLVDNLPDILSSGLQNVITGITNSLNRQFTACTSALGKTLGLGAATDGLSALTTALQPGLDTLTGALSQVTDPLTTASSAPLMQLAAGLKQVLDIGLNVQSGPGTQDKDTTYPYVTGLKATPDQATPVVAKQTLVRAIEIDLLPAAGGGTPGGTLPGLPSIPGAGAPTGASASSRQIAGTPRRAAASGGAAVLALSNAAAGPSVFTNPKSDTDASALNRSPSDAIPTGVPAGAAGHLGDSPTVPIVLVLLGLLLAGGVTAYRVRGKFGH